MTDVLELPLPHDVYPLMRKMRDAFEEIMTLLQQDEDRVRKGYMLLQQERDSMAREIGVWHSQRPTHIVPLSDRGAAELTPTTSWQHTETSCDNDVPSGGCVLRHSEYDVCRAEAAVDRESPAVVDPPRRLSRGEARTFGSVPSARRSPPSAPRSMAVGSSDNWRQSQLRQDQHHGAPCRHTPQSGSRSDEDARSESEHSYSSGDDTEATNVRQRQHVRHRYYDGSQTAMTVRGSASPRPPSAASRSLVLRDATAERAHIRKHTTHEVATSRSPVFWIHVWPCFGTFSSTWSVPARVFVASHFRYMEDVTEVASKVLHCQPAPLYLYEADGTIVRDVASLKPESHYLLFPSGGRYADDKVPVALLELLVNDAREALRDGAEP